MTEGGTCQPVKNIFCGSRQPDFEINRNPALKLCVWGFSEAAFKRPGQQIKNAAKMYGECR